MRIFAGILQKMQTEYNDPIQYFLHSDAGRFCLSEFVGKKMIFSFSEHIECLRCKKKIKKTYQDAYCYPCFLQAPETAPCIIFPEKCQAHLGLGKNIEWEQQYHNCKHYVYLAFSSCVKVGITGSVLTRWMDQGASYGTILAETPNRYLAGCVEVELKKFYTDKTPWQKMLQNEFNLEVDVLTEKKTALSYLSKDLLEQIQPNLTAEYFSLNYPILRYPQKIQTLQPEKTPKMEFELWGIKGQYLLTSLGVINLRKYGGHQAIMDVIN